MTNQSYPRNNDLSCEEANILKVYSGGYFDNKEDAIAAVDKLRKELHGEFARS